VGAVLLAVTALVAATVVFGGFSRLLAPAVQAATTATTDFKMTVTPTQNLTDGESMKVTVTRTSTGTAAGLEITSIGVGWCTGGFQLPLTAVGQHFSPTEYSTLPPLSGTRAHCTTRTHPLNADLVPTSAIAPAAKSTGDYSSVTGTVEVESSGGTTVGQHSTGTLVCDASSSCTFVVAVFTKVATTTSAKEPTIFLSVPVTYLSSTSAAACNGAAPGELTTAGPTRLNPLITDWTLDACGAGVGGGRALTDGFVPAKGDATALAAFAGGSADLAYSAVGYGATTKFTPSVARPYVAIPIALDSVVLAHTETSQVVTSAPVASVYADYPQLDITAAQFATLLSNGTLKWNSSLGQALVAENPSLGAVLNGYYNKTSEITLADSSGTNGVVVSSLGDATTLFATTFAHALAPADMVSGPSAAAAQSEKVLGVTSDFGTATPKFNAVPASGFDITAKDLTPGRGEGFAVTSSVAAATYWGGMADFAMQTPGSIGSATPTYVTATATSMHAAVPEMIPQPDGTLSPNPDATQLDGVQAYPLTFVEYAIAPTQPLLNANCTPRTQSQADLTTWLNYITGVGQTELPAGLAPLTTTLEAKAQAAIAQVGTAAPACTASAAATSTSATTSTSSGGGASSTATTSPATTTTGSAGATKNGSKASSGSSLSPSSSSGFRSEGGSGNTTNPGVGAAKGSTTPTRRAQRQLAVDLAGFRTIGPAGWVLPMVGILLLVVLLPGLALLLSGRTPRQALSGLTGRVSRRRKSWGEPQ
jgi:hypothetical protein